MMAKIDIFLRHNDTYGHYDVEKYAMKKVAYHTLLMQYAA
jgi:hypothetical protein